MSNEMTVEEISAAVAVWSAGEPLVRRVYLFGSRAKRTSRPDSDADLAILHKTDPKVLSTCDPEVSHWLTWMDRGGSWGAALQARLSVRAHVQQIDRGSKKIVWPALKACRICLYKRVG